MEVLKQKIISAIKLVYDPEIPVDVYELGLIYDIQINEDFTVEITMTLTSPNCPVADSLVNDVYIKVKEIDEIKDVEMHLTFDPPWDANMASEVAHLQMGLL
jgi:FeS assembly SUF system protein